MNKEERVHHFLKRAEEIHNNKYDYSKVNYIDTSKKVIIICPTHGEFQQRPHGHLQKKGCSQCYGNKKLTTKEFIERCSVLHGDKYDYSKVIYKNKRSYVEIICPIHGSFIQKAENHFHRKGCYKCKESKGEKIIKNFLTSKKIEFVSEKKFDNCRNKKPLPFDFYIENKNLLIEYDGELHFKSVKYYGGDNGLEYRIKNDKIKTNFALENNINLLRISYKSFNDIETIIKKYL